MVFSLNDALEQWGPAFEKNRHYGHTSAGQKYAITVSRFLIGYYKVCLFLDEPFMSRTGLKPFHTERCMTQSQVDEQVSWLKKRLKRSPLLEYKGFASCGPHIDYFLTMVKMPDECKRDPERFLSRGQHIGISRQGGIYSHDAIYIGDGEVIHVFGENKSESKVQKDKYSTFIGDPSSYWGTVSVVVYRLKNRSLEEIAEEAEKILEGNLHDVDYNFLTQNCQHFASYCSTGYQISYGASGAWDALYQGLYALAAGGGGKGPRVGRALGQKFDSPLDYER